MNESRCSIDQGFELPDFINHMAVINERNEKITNLKGLIESSRVLIGTLESEYSSKEFDRYRSRMHQMRIDQERLKLAEAENDLDKYRDDLTDRLYGLLKDSMGMLESLEKQNSF